MCLHTNEYEISVKFGYTNKDDVVWAMVVIVEIVIRVMTVIMIRSDSDDEEAYHSVFFFYISPVATFSS